MVLGRYEIGHASVRPGTLIADAGSIPQIGIELAADFRHMAGAKCRWKLVGLFATGAGFRTFPQEFEAVLRR
jgi:hypothetical protein